MRIKILNTAGLVLGIIGVIFIFVWGFPQPSFERSVGLAVEPATPIDAAGTTAEQHAQEVDAMRNRYVMRSYAGIGFIGLGFFCQLLAIWIPERLPQLPPTKTKSDS